MNTSKRQSRLEATADPRKMVNMARLADSYSDQELHDWFRSCLRVARQQGRREGAQKRGIDLVRLQQVAP